MIQPDIFKNALDLINSSSKILVTTHTRPDGDACGSAAAIAQAIKAQGKKAAIMLLSELPEWYEFLFDENPIFFEPDKNLKPLDEADLIILVDVNSDNQLAKFADWLKSSKKKVLVFDHHVTNDGLGDLEVIDTTASATGVIIFDFLKFAGWEAAEKIAASIFVAISSDTGWFRFSNTDARSFTVAAQLIGSGVKPNEIYRRLYENYSPQRFKLMTRMLSSLELHFDNRFAIQQLRLCDFEQNGASNKETENLIDECRKISGLEGAALLVELKDGRVRCSLRSSGKIDVRNIAKEFGGGGHVFAAGAYLPGPLENARQILLELLKKQFEIHFGGQ
ncbi:MAG: bifunctional oligoribonuclease/PAP phosphatase NrnA [Phycisphaerae bacterium]